VVFFYRKNGGQVYGAATVNPAYDGVDAPLFGTIIDPPTPDGEDLATPKIFDGTNVRNATAGEITSFALAEAADTTLILRTLAKQRLQNDPILRKLLGALLSVILMEINRLRQNPTTTFGAISHGTAINAILTAIDSGSFD
jgi:hypothetical protein